MTRLFLKVAEAAEAMQVDPRTLRKGIDDGVIPAVRIGNTIRIPTAPFLALCGVASDNDEAAALRPATAPQMKIVKSPVMNPDTPKAIA